MKHLNLLLSGICLFFTTTLAAQNTKTKPPIIIVDDVMMLSTPAAGLENMACCPYPSSRTVAVPAGKQCRVDWKEGRKYGRDTLRIIRLEILKAGRSVAQFTLTLKTRTSPMTLQCMKGFGCSETAWATYPWKSPKGNFLEHTTHQFRVTPKGGTHLMVENLDPDESITVRINPCSADNTPKKRLPVKN